MMLEQEGSIGQRASRYTLIALLVSLVAYPVLYSTDFFGNILFLVLPEGIYSSLLDENSRAEWWYFWLTNMAFHWIPFFFVWMALHKNGERWDSIGVNWQWFGKYKIWFLILFVFLIISAFIVPGIHYGDTLPLKSRAGFIGPISSIERLFIIFGALTAAVTEEILFRGFAFTRLKRWISNPWLILPITVISFVLIHGEPRSIGQVSFYVIGGLAFGIPFILMGLRRLEMIVLMHFFIDASLVLMP